MRQRASFAGAAVEEHAREQHAPVRLADLEGRVLAALEGGLERVQAEPTFLLLWTVARHAMRIEQRLNHLGVVGLLRRRERFGGLGFARDGRGGRQRTGEEEGGPADLSGEGGGGVGHRASITSAPARRVSFAP